MITNRFKSSKNITLPETLSSKYGDVDGLSLQNLYYTRNGVFPSCFLFDYEARTNGDFNFDTIKMSKYIMDNIDPDENPEISTYYTKVLGRKEGEDIDMGFCLILNKSQIYARIEKRVTESYILYSNEHIEELEKFVEMVLQFYIAPEGEENTYWKIACSQNGYYLEKGYSKCPENFEVRKLYNDDFADVDEKICKFIEEDNKSGLVILHGEKGTGKSSYIKNIIKKFPDKKFVNVPAHLVNLLGDPSFGSFLTSLDNHVIILEDCENVIRDRKQMNYGSAVSLLLNMTDGLMADDLSIKFICTFNEDMRTIDPALLRKGRCVAKYEFKPLCKEKAEMLLKERGIDAIVEKPITLADIYHYEDADYQIKKNSII